MTTEDIRVIRPACEKIFTGEYSGNSLLDDVVNLFIKKRDYAPTIDTLFSIELSAELLQDKRYCDSIGIPFKKLQALPAEEKTRVLYEMSKKIDYLVTDVYRLAPMVHTIRRYMFLPEKERNVFVFEGNFYDKFSKVSLDNLTTDHLPKEGCGCMILPKPLIFGSVRIDEVLFTTVAYYEYLKDALEKTFERTKTDPAYLKDSMQELLKIKKLVDGGTPLQLLIVGIDRDRKSVSVCNLLDLVPHKKLKDLPDRDLDSYDEDLNSRCAHTARLVIDQVLNLLAYIKSGRPDIREFRNVIRYRGKSTVHVRPEDEELSLGRLFLVGFNWLKKPNYTIAGWWSSGYMYWRMCGPGKTEPQLIYAKGSFKQRRKGKEDIVTEESAIEGEDFEEC